MYKTALISEWGTLFGLTLKDLTTEQIEKISFVKLLEFLNQNPEIEDILCKKISKVKSHDIQKIYDIRNEVKNFPKLIASYNEFIRSPEALFVESRDCYYLRYKLIIWDILDDQNKETEFKRWLDGKVSVINECNIDFTWLTNYNKELAETTIKKIIVKAPATGYHVSVEVKNLISTLPKDEYLTYLPDIFTKSKYLFVRTLSNPHTPDKYIIEALRALNVITEVPEINVKISIGVLNSLPPITRLNVLEKIVSWTCNKCHYTYESKYDPLMGIKTIDDFKQLVFSSTVRHHDRVSRLTDNYQLIVNWRNK